MNNYSEVTIKDVWPKLCDLGIVELKVNGFTEWSDHAMDPMFGRDDYDDIATDYLKRAEKELLKGWDNFRVTSINIKIVLDHHCVADIEGYFTDDEYSLEEIDRE